MTRQWTVKVDGNNVKTLHDGESVEIGRKPLRPLSDDGFVRLDIMDPGKSMSKRHAVLSVDKQGNCSVRDLHSTNGSFVVTNNGQLMRLPAGEDIKLPIDSMTLQFGDVRLTLESAFEHDDEDDDATSGVSDDTSQPVSNLFEYAVSDEAPQEPDAADMSVDDILNLRAGEPTTFFHARNVTDRADALHAAFRLRAEERGRRSAGHEHRARACRRRLHRGLQYRQQHVPRERGMQGQGYADGRKRADDDPHQPAVQEHSEPLLRHGGGRAEGRRGALTAHDRHRHLFRRPERGGQWL